MTRAGAAGEPADALERLVALRLTTARLRDEFSAASAAQRPAALHRLLLALELRWILEEQVLIPALGTRGAYDLLRVAERESGLLRDLASVARGDTLAAAAQGALAVALEGLAALRSERIEHALLRAQRSAHFDAAALRREMDQLLERWHQEVLATGDIEDEELDPVGLPPR